MLTFSAFFLNAVCRATILVSLLCYWMSHSCSRWVWRFAFSLRTCSIIILSIMRPKSNVVIEFVLVVQLFVSNCLIVSVMLGCTYLTLQRIQNILQSYYVERFHQIYVAQICWFIVFYCHLYDLTINEHCVNRFHFLRFCWECVSCKSLVNNFMDVSKIVRRIWCFHLLNSVVVMFYNSLV